MFLFKVAGRNIGLNESPRGKLRGIKKTSETFPQVVTPECLNRGSSPKFAWIPAKSMRE